MTQPFSFISQYHEVLQTTARNQSNSPKLSNFMCYLTPSYINKKWQRVCFLSCLNCGGTSSLWANTGWCCCMLGIWGRWPPFWCESLLSSAPILLFPSYILSLLFFHRCGGPEFALAVPFIASLSFDQGRCFRFVWRMLIISECLLAIRRSS
jgi:hypothetical protein